MFIFKQAQEFGVQYLCQALKVSKSGFYSWLHRKEPLRASETTRLKAIIEVIYQKGRKTYGSPRIFKALKRGGMTVGKNRVAKIMKAAGIKARVAKIYRRLGGLHKFFTRFPNRRRETEKPTRVNQQWAADLTYLTHGSQRHYLAAFMDLYSRKIVGWALGNSKDSKLTMAALMYALRNRKPEPGLIFHTDRGSEYLSYEYQRINQRYGIIPSMNRPGKCTDNAEMESFFHSLKGEIIKGRAYRSEVDLRNSVCGYIHHFYNRTRLHSSLNYCSPVEFESGSN